MPVLYVSEQGATVGVVRTRLVVRKGRSLLGEVHLDDCPQVVLAGRVQVTTEALRAALKKGTEVLLLTRGGRFLGRLSGGLSGHVELRQAQFRMLADAARGLDLARRCVEGKIANQRTLLIRHQRGRSDEVIAAALARLRRIEGGLGRAADGDQLRGYEGSASRDFFQGFGRLFTAEGMEFHGRVRRPPTDPVNLLLSFGYTLLGGVLHGLVEQAGMDPYLGALHAPERGRPSLVLDLMEEFRPVLVDATVLRAVNTKAIAPRDFAWLDADAPAEVEDEWERDDREAGIDPLSEPDPDGDDAHARARRRLLITPLGARKWFLAFERRLEEGVRYEPLDCQLTYRQVLREQVYRMARHFLGQGEYEAYRHKA